MTDIQLSTDHDPRHAVAVFRYGLIADFVHLPLGTKGLYRRLEEKAAREYIIPGTARTRVAAETLRDWLKRYRQGGFEALLPKPRADRGTPPGRSRPPSPRSCSRSRRPTRHSPCAWSSPRRTPRGQCPKGGTCRPRPCTACSHATA